MNSSADPQTSAAAIAIDGLSKTFNPQLERLRRFFRRPVKPPVTALRDVSLTVRRGEIVGLIGRNGAGKTTLTKIVATLVQPTSGTVLVNGSDSVRDERAVRAQIGLCTAEERSFYWRLTAEQNLMFFGRLYGLSDTRARRRIIELFERLELMDLATRRFSELSTGNKQKLALARALLAEPPVLLLDEPTRSLDPLAAERMRALISELARGEARVSILLTSHNLVEIEQLCDRIAIIADGSIRAQGTPAELRSSHRPTEVVTIRIAGTSEADRWRELAELDFLVELDRTGNEAGIRFSRATDDDRLDRVLGLVQSSEARIVSVASERSTLLEVLEGLEQVRPEDK